MKGDLGIGEQKRCLDGEGKRHGAGDKQKRRCLYLVPEAGAGSSSTAVPMNMQGKSSPSKVGFPQKEKETLRCRSNSSTSASSPPSNEIACLNWTSSRRQTNPLKEWTFRAVSVFEWILVGCSVAGLLVSFIFHPCKFHVLGSIPWKLCVLVLVIVCGWHFMGWMMMRVKDPWLKGYLSSLSGTLILVIIFMIGEDCRSFSVVCFNSSNMVFIA
ncbi:hypothetical protein SLA2020_525260 [Shorea laevis]